MKTTTAILIAVALTAFVLVLAGSLVFAVNSKTLSANLAAQDTMENTQPIVNDQAVQNPAPVNAPQPVVNVPTIAAPTQPPAPTQIKLVAAERAAQIALRLMPGSSLQQPPELVNYKGKMAYEVLLNTATIYVDAFSGKILASNALVVQNQQPPTDSDATDNNGGGGGGEQVRDTNPQPDPGGNDASQDQSWQDGESHDDDGHDDDHGKNKGGEHDDDDDEHEGDDD